MGIVSGGSVLGGVFLCRGGDLCVVGGTNFGRRQDNL